MDTVTANMAGRIRNRVSKYIDDGIKVEVLTLQENHFDFDARLPSGNNFFWSIL